MIKHQDSDTVWETKQKVGAVQRMVMERSHDKDEISKFTKNTQRFSLLVSPLQQSFSTESSQIPPQQMSIRFRFHFHFLFRLCLLDFTTPQDHHRASYFHFHFLFQADFFIILKIKPIIIIFIQVVCRFSGGEPAYVAFQV